MKWIYGGVNLKKILKGVSRSFYLSLILLPKKVRLQMGLAFLACKAADTIADTDLIPSAERLKLLDAYREMFGSPAEGHAATISSSVKSQTGGSAAEYSLIQGLPALMEALNQLSPQDRLLIQELVLELTQGMQIDLAMKGLETEAELEQYIYYVAGCVGRFWTRMIRNHFGFAAGFGPEVEALGERLGKGLQLVNILRDLPRDVQRGRHYIPKGLELSQLSQKAKNYLASYRPYLSYYPWYACRLKAVVRLPARLGLQTLDLLANSEEWPNPARVHKLSRRQVYQTLLRSFLE